MNLSVICYNENELLITLKNYAFILFLYLFLGYKLLAVSKHEYTCNGTIGSCRNFGYITDIEFIVNPILKCVRVKFSKYDTTQ